MAGFDQPDDEFSDFALPPEIEEVSVPARLKFAPWHKPRKQFVRQNQWIHHAQQTILRLKNEGKISSSGTVSYLTLPGPDMLDVRMMAEVCKSENLMLRYTGFCNVSEEEGTRLRRNTAQFHLDLEGTIQKGSDVHRSRLEEVAIRGSSAQTMMKRGGPYLIVNIDACEPLLNRDVHQTARLIDAIREIIQYQVDATRTPWLLYLTTPAQAEWVDADSLEVLKNEVISNAARDMDFAAGLAGQYRGGESIEDYLVRSLSSNGFEFCSVFALGVAKWMLHMAEQANFKMIKKESFCYSMLRRSPTFPNMISTCYIFVPVTIDLTDRTGLTVNDAGAEVATRPKSAHLHALDKSLRMIDLDEKLSRNPIEAAQLVAQSKHYLSQVGYDVDDPESGYDAWLEREAAQLENEYLG